MKSLVLSRGNRGSGWKLTPQFHRVSHLFPRIPQSNFIVLVDTGLSITTALDYSITKIPSIHTSTHDPTLQQTHRTLQHIRRQIRLLPRDIQARQQPHSVRPSSEDQQTSLPGQLHQFAGVRRVLEGDPDYETTPAEFGLDEIGEVRREEGEARAEVD